MTGLLYERTPEQVEIDAEILARVKKGIALLEKKHGPDWYMKIDLDKLQLRSADHCVLGQLYGDEDDGWGPSGYAIGCRSLMKKRHRKDSDKVKEWAAKNGFSTSSFKEPWNGLQEAWVHALTPLVRS